MKNINLNLDDSLRREYKRSDFGELVRGKYGVTQVEFAELTSLLLACVGEEEGITFTHHHDGNYLATHRMGDWTFSFDNANQITLRYWLSDFRSVEEGISNPPCVSDAKERSELQSKLVEGVCRLKKKVSELAG